MREIIFRCNHCGKVIEGNPFQICANQVSREEYPDIVDIENKELNEAMEKVADMDWCENCFRNVITLLADTSHKLLVAPPVTQEPFEFDLGDPEASVVKMIQKKCASDPSPDASGGHHPKEQKLIWEN